MFLSEPSVKQLQRALVAAAGVGAAVMLVLATPLLSWSLIGAPSEQGGSDYMIKLPSINPMVGTALGWASLAMFSGASFLLWRHGRHLLFERGYWRVLLG